MASRIMPTADTRQRRPRVRDEKHLDFIRTLPCMICRCTYGSANDAAHVRFADAAHDKRETGKSERPDDKWTVPLCRSCHLDGPDAQHGSGEREWWEAAGIDVLAVCEALYAVTGHYDLALKIVANPRMDYET